MLQRSEFPGVEGPYFRSVLGSTWQNAWLESFNGRLLDRFLNVQQFEALFEAQVVIEEWWIGYNMNRPHSAHGWLTPVEFVEAWLNEQALLLA